MPIEDAGGNALVSRAPVAQKVATFTRPANTTAYASGQLVANNTVAGSVVPLQFTVTNFQGGGGAIRRVRIQKSGNVLTAAQFRLHLYTASPTPVNGDGGVWSTNQAAAYLGSFDVTLDKAFTDGAQGVGTPQAGLEMNFALATNSQTLFGLLEARGAYTPISGEVFNVTLEVVGN